MNIKRSIGRIAAISVVAFSVIGCDQDYETLGSNIIGEPGFNADVYDAAEVSATSVQLPPVQTNNLPVHLLGYYNHQVFGEQTANILTQLSLSQPNPTFGAEATVDSVVLKIPYFSKELDPEEDGKRVFELDSVIGNSPLQLSIVESGLFLNNYDPDSNFEKAQKYYSDMHAQIEGNATGAFVLQDTVFTPSAKEIVEIGPDADGVVDTTYAAPAMRIKLSNEFFQNKIIAREGAAELSSDTEFKNYLRGIYIKAQNLNGNDNMMLLNLKNANSGITIYYTSQKADADDADDDGDTTETIGVQDSYKLNFGPTVVNTFQQEQATFSPENIYLKGGEGAMATIELFGPDADNNGTPDELELLREKEWLVNEANLSFYVKQDLMNESEQPKQLFIYDLKNRTVLADYVFDTQGAANQPTSQSNQAHLGVLERDEDKNGVKYKIRLTNYVNSLLNRDSTNVRLGLVVTQNVNLITNSALKTPVDGVNFVPAGSVVSPLGTVLYGPNAADEEKRLKLNIYYTEIKD